MGDVGEAPAYSTVHILPPGDVVGKGQGIRSLPCRTSNLCLTVVSPLCLAIFYWWGPHRPFEDVSAREAKGGPR